MDAVAVLDISAPFLSRQMQVLLLWIMRFSYKDIAHAMQIEDQTVNSHLDQVQTKWELDDRGDLARAAIIIFIPYFVQIGAVYGKDLP